MHFVSCRITRWSILKACLTRRVSHQTWCPSQPWNRHPAKVVPGKIILQAARLQRLNGVPTAPARLWSSPRTQTRRPDLCEKASFGTKTIANGRLVCTLVDVNTFWAILTRKSKRQMREPLNIQIKKKKFAFCVVRPCIVSWHVRCMARHAFGRNVYLHRGVCQ